LTLIVLAYSLWISLKVILRRTPVFLAISTIVALSTVVTIALIASEYPAVTSHMLLERLKPGAGLKLVEGGPGDVGVCLGSLERGGVSLEVLILVPSPNTSFWSYYKVGEPRAGSILVGRGVSELLGVRGGDLVRLSVGGEVLDVVVSGVIRFNNFLDLAVVAPSSFGSRGCSLGYVVSEYSPLDVVKAFSEQLSGSLTQWYAVSLIALAVAITLASLKTLLDLEGELSEMEAQGAPRGLVLAGLPVAFAFSTATGASYGFVLSSIAASTLGSYMGLYIPPPPLTPMLLLKTLIIPSIISITVPLVVGVLLWRFKAY
jgi:hypothetical protein